MQVFFVIRLHSASTPLQTVRDPDPLVSNDLMDGRDAFLMSAREKHYEFSTLRRAKFSSMAMLYELHTQGRDSFVYTCNACKANMETHYHCATCDVSSRTCSSSCCCFSSSTCRNIGGRLVLIAVVTLLVVSVTAKPKWKHTTSMPCVM